MASTRGGSAAARPGTAAAQRHYYASRCRLRLFVLDAAQDLEVLLRNPHQLALAVLLVQALPKAAPTDRQGHVIAEGNESCCRDARARVRREGLQDEHASPRVLSLPHGIAPGSEARGTAGASVQAANALT